jgi:hypothetical protein
MFEGLFAFVWIVAVWKIVQVWMLKRQIRQQKAQIATVNREMAKIVERFVDMECKLKEFSMLYPGCSSVKKTDDDWPEII